MEGSEERFTPVTFVKDKALVIAGGVLFVVFITFVLQVLQVSAGGIIFVDVMTILFFGSVLVYDYLRQAAFWRMLAATVDSLDRSSHFATLVERPAFLQGKVAYDAAFTLSQTSNQETTDLRERARSNSEYIELWVHEAKTPLSAAKLLAKRMSGPDALTLRRELERMDDLIGQALFTARAESLDRDYLIREVALLDIVREVCKSHMHYLTSLDVALEMNIDSKLTVFADRIWLEFIITQIVINAAKYDAKTIAFNASASENESSSSCTVLEIKDDGCGIPAADVPRVFDQGFTGEVGRAHGSATGMGLYLVARMCTSMGLSVMLASEEGVGTRVQISFPHDRRRAQLESTNLTNP